MAALKKITPEQIEAIKHKLLQGIPATTVAKEYGVHLTSLVRYTGGLTQYTKNKYIGQTFGKYTIIGLAQEKGCGNGKKVICKCNLCEHIFTTSYSYLKLGKKVRCSNCSKLKKL